MHSLSRRTAIQSITAMVAMAFAIPAIALEPTHDWVNGRWKRRVYRNGSSKLEPFSSIRKGDSFVVYGESPIPDFALEDYSERGYVICKLQDHHKFVTWTRMQEAAGSSHFAQFAPGLPIQAAQVAT